MSIAVPLEQLAQVVAEFGTTGYLMSTGADGRPRVNHVRFSASGSELRAGVGRRTAEALAANPLVSCLWPAPAEGGMNLIADGAATLERSGEETTAVIAVTWAVRHAPPRSAAGTGQS
jgi:hypothetical protein